MNDILTALHARRSVRAYLDRPISDADKKAILLAACAAPTAGNQQLYTILDITDQALKDALAESCDHQSFIAQAPMVLVFCADCRKWYDAYAEAGLSPRTPGAGDLLLAVTDAAIAAQNAVTAAESLGIGSCYIGDILEQYETHRELLCLPEYVVPSVMLVFGYPTEQQKRREKPQRFDLRHIVHENRYRHMDGPELREMFAPRAANGYDAWVAAFCKRKYESDFAREMTRSVGQYLKQFDSGEEQEYNCTKPNSGGTVMEKVYEFLKAAGTYYLATVDGDQPRVRPFGTVHIFEGRLYIQTGKSKDVSRQLAANPKAELCAFKDGVWVRVSGKLVEDDRVEARKSMLDAYPDLRAMYDENDGNTQVLYFQDAAATFSSFTAPPETVRF